MSVNVKKDHKAIVAVLSIKKRGATTIKTVKGEVTPVVDHWKFDTKDHKPGFFGSDYIQPKSAVVYTTEKDYEVSEHMDLHRMELTQETWDYYSAPQFRTKGKKKFFTNIPSRSAMHPRKMEVKDFVRNPSKFVNLSEHSKSLQYVNPEELARFILYVEDVVGTMLSTSDVHPSDYSLEILENIVA